MKERQRVETCDKGEGAAIVGFCEQHLLNAKGNVDKRVG